MPTWGTGLLAQRWAPPTYDRQAPFLSEAFPEGGRRGGCHGSLASFKAGG